jgi:hypothetical protein
MASSEWVRRPAVVFGWEVTAALRLPPLEPDEEASVVQVEVRPAQTSDFARRIPVVANRSQAG